jgi:hypothetical protein
LASGQCAQPVLGSLGPSALALHSWYLLHLTVGASLWVMCMHVLCLLFMHTFTTSQLHRDRPI